MRGVPSVESDRIYSREEFRRWCAQQKSGRFERIDGRIVPMAPETGAHLRVKSAVWLALRNAIRAAGVPCQALPDGATIETGESDYEPDAVVNFGPPIADDAITPPNPVIVIEVLSPGTAAADNVGKLAGYFQVPSVVHYLIIHATKRVVTHHRRTSEGIQTQIIVAGAIALAPQGIAISLDEIYEADRPARHHPPDYFPAR